MARDWQPDSWRSRRTLPDPGLPTARILRRGAASGGYPLARVRACATLKDKLAEVCARPGPSSRAATCAEAFADFAADKIRDSLRVLLQMAVVLTFGAGLQW